MRVLHSVDVYLGVSENWIYPQITRVPGTETRVICGAVANREDFPIEEGRLRNRNPHWDSRNKGARLRSRLLRWSGVGDVITTRWICRWSPEVIHSHFGPRGWSDLGLKRSSGARMVTSFYGYDAWSIPETGPLWRERYGELFEHCDLVLVEGPAMQRKLVALGCPSDKVRIVRLGVDVASLAFRMRSFGGELRIAMVGRYVEKKGLVDGMRACAIARKGGVKLRLTIVGDAQGDDAKGQAIKRTLLEMAQQPELSGYVHFTGFLPLSATRTLLSQQDVLLCPSKQGSDGNAEGGSPVVLTEAMAMGLFCIGTKHCDIPEVIRDRQTGFLCDEGDVFGLAESLNRLAMNHVRLVDMTVAGRRHIENSFNLVAQLDGISASYQSLC
jgi:colanic acid/amylovoran biosynthesis glycosyltransferase